RGKQLQPAPAPRLREERPQHVEVVAGENDVLAEALAPFRPLSVNQARDVEIEGLLLAAAAVGDHEGAAAHHRHEGEEVEAPDRADAVTEGEPVLLEGGDGDRVIDPEERAVGRLQRLDRPGEEPAVAEELEAVEADDPEAALRQLDDRLGAGVDER